MEISKREALNILDIIKIIENLNQLDILGYTFLRNTILLESVEKEHQKISEFIRDEFIKKFDIDKEKLSSDKDYISNIDKKFVEYIQNNKDLENFLNETINIDFVTFDLENLKEEKFKPSLIKPLLGKIIIG